MLYSKPNAQYYQLLFLLFTLLIHYATFYIILIYFTVCCASLHTME